MQDVKRRPVQSLVPQIKETKVNRQVFESEVESKRAPVADQTIWEFCRIRKTGNAMAEDLLVTW
jgi:hypothetical protein